MRPQLLVGVGVLLTLPLLGCGGLKNAAQRNQDNLRELAQQYSSFQDMKGKPPASFDELLKFANQLPAGIAQLNVPWGAGMMGMYKGGGASTQAVFAYGAASSGVVPVMMADGTVTTMKQAEFNSAKKVSR